MLITTLDANKNSYKRHWHVLIRFVTSWWVVCRRIHLAKGEIACYPHLVSNAMEQQVMGGRSRACYRKILLN
jgi:hypothetical protein